MLYAMNLQSGVLVKSLVRLGLFAILSTTSALSWGTDFRVNLITQLEGCGGMLSLTDGHQQISVSIDLLTSARQQEFSKTYPQLKLTATSEKITANISEMSDPDAVDFLADLLFLQKNPSTPLENLSVSLTNFLPQDESQKTALEFAKKLVDYSGTRASGLFLSGNTGTGKTHISIAVAKEFLKRGLRPILISPDTFELTREEIQQYDTFLFDDLNSGYGEGANSFVKVISHVHDFGGKIFVTNNTGFETMFDEIAGPHSSRKAEGPRLLDRIKTMFKFLELKGESYRSKGAWFN